MKLNIFKSNEDAYTVIPYIKIRNKQLNIQINDGILYILN